MYFLPSYGRPHAIQELLNAPGKMPVNVTVIVNEDDPLLTAYRMVLAAIPYWTLELCPAGSRFVDAWSYVFKQHPNLPWYGMLGDDHIAQTEGWHETLVKEAGTEFLAYPNGAHTEFPLMRGVCVIGGDLVRAMGFICAPFLRHNYVDVVLDHIARDAGLLKPCGSERVDHQHWKFTPKPIDETYLRGSHDQGEDAQRYHTWLSSQDRAILYNNIAQWATRRGIGRYAYAG